MRSLVALVIVETALLGYLLGSKHEREKWALRVRELMSEKTDD